MSILFTPVNIGSLKVKNRFVRSATQDYFGNLDGTISDKQKELYRDLAKNDVGMVISGHSYVQYPLGRANLSQNAIYNDKFIEGFNDVANILHKENAVFIVQISHAGRQVQADSIQDQTPLAPSAVTDKSTGITPKALTEDEIWEWIDDFVLAIKRVKDSGADGVQIHIAHGYGLSQFISPYTNRRSDEWGGSLKNRVRIIREIMERGRAVVGSDYPILAKLNSTDGFTGENYLNLDDVVEIAKELEIYGITAIEVSGGIREAKGAMSKPGIKRTEDEAYYAATAKVIKKAVNIPVIAVGGFRSKPVMEEVIKDKISDMVALCRPFLHEPDLVKKLAAGQNKAGCISCNACFNTEGAYCYALKNKAK